MDDESFFEGRKGQVEESDTHIMYSPTGREKRHSNRGEGGVGDEGKNMPFHEKRHKEIGNTE